MYTKNSVIRLKEIYKDHLASMYEIYDAGGADSLNFLPVFKILEIIDTDRQLRYKKLLDLLNVKYLISVEKYKDLDKLRLGVLSFFEKRMYIYKNLSYLPRVFTVTKAKYLEEDEQILDYILFSDIDFKKEVIIKSNKYSNDDENVIHTNNNSQVEIIEYSSNRVRIKAMMT